MNAQNEAQVTQTLRGRCQTIRETLDKAYALAVKMAGPMPPDDRKAKEPVTALDLLANELEVVQCYAESILDRLEAAISIIE